MTGLLCACHGAPQLRARAPRPGERALRVLTYNVNFGLAGDGATLAAIAAARADVVFLQETTPSWEAALRRSALARRYPTMRFVHSSGAGGLALLSRFAVQRDEVIPAPSGWFPAWRVVLATPIGRVQALQVHLHPPVSESGSFVSGYFTTDGVRAKEMRAFVAKLRAGLPTIVVGDFNERSGDAVRLLRRRGLSTALPQFHPSATTWRWKVASGLITLRERLDHVFYGKRLQPLDARVLRAGRSDHLPVLVVLARR